LLPLHEQVERSSRNPIFRISSRDIPTRITVWAADLVREGVRKTREKLSDLSMRNAMLSFRHSETSAKQVRIIYEDL
jgi:hypothetical protein